MGMGELKGCNGIRYKSSYGSQISQLNKIKQQYIIGFTFPFFVILMRMNHIIHLFEGWSAIVGTDLVGECVLLGVGFQVLKIHTIQFALSLLYNWCFSIDFLSYCSGAIPVCLPSYGSWTFPLKLQAHQKLFLL